MVLFRPWTTNEKIYFHYGNFANLYSEKIIKESTIIERYGFC